MRTRPQTLLNAADVEAWPAWLCPARRNHDARHLAHARWLLRRKHDGRYLAATGDNGTTGLIPDWQRTPGIVSMLDRLDERLPRDHASTLPLHRLQQRLDMLGIDADAYAADSGLALEPEPARLQLAGFDRYRRPLWLRADAARAWQHMQAAALHDDVPLDAISGYRSHDYQLGIFARKRARGLPVADILTVNAAPGFSEHHSGRALDIGTPGEPAAEESFENTLAFRWLMDNAAAFDFHLSYPRGNPHGIVYEPWHWCWRAAPLS